MSFRLFGGDIRFRLYPRDTDAPRGRRDKQGRTKKAKRSRSNKNGKRPQWNDWKKK